MQLCRLLRVLLSEEDTRGPRWTFHGLAFLALKLGVLLVCLNELLYFLSFEEVRAVVYQERLVQVTAAVNRFFVWAVVQFAHRKVKSLVLIAGLVVVYEISKTRQGRLWRCYNWCFRSAGRVVRKVLV